MPFQRFTKKPKTVSSDLSVSAVHSHISLRLFRKNAFTFACSAAFSPPTAEPRFGGGHTGAVRCTGAISADLREPAVCI